MSFAAEVKKELCERGGSYSHLCLAELAALFLLGSRMETGEDGQRNLRFSSDNPLISKKCFTFLKKSFNMSLRVSEREQQEGRRTEFSVIVEGNDSVRTVLHALGLERSDGGELPYYVWNPRTLRNQSCKRAWIRGLFLMGGRISDPAKSYHFEITLPDSQTADCLMQCIGEFTREPKLLKRKQQWVVYVKDGAQIADLLTIMEAHVSLMKYENERIVREVRGSVNRRVNCEVSNLNKTLAAARKQVEDITWIQERMGLERLPENLQEVARLRLEHTEASLQELGELLHPPLGRSGVNHRLQKLCEIAEGLRSN